MAAAGGESLASLQAAVKRQGELIRQMKKDGCGEDVLVPEVAKLKTLKIALAKATEAEGASSKWPVDKVKLEDAVVRKMFVVPSFEIYGGVGGLFDYGPTGCALKDNLLQQWRQHFILEENMLQIECTTLTPFDVLKTSGHVDKFIDLMVKDPATGECFRADKMLEDHIETMLKDPELPAERREDLKRIARQADSYDPEELDTIFKDLKIRSPTTGNELSKSFPFNLMFETRIGPGGDLVGFLRPETAQGMFVNFRRLIDFAGGRMPVAAAQIGLAFRNEIAPRNGLLRVREFTMAEIEHFVDPMDKSHAKFGAVADLRLNLFPAASQVGDGLLATPTLREAVASGLINNETLAYFMGRTFLFLTSVGIRPEGLRFRQHLRSEMAHYASDCWDAEVLMSSGWVECVGHADRACYDLDVHARRTHIDMVAERRLPEPKIVHFAVADFNRGLVGRTFKDGAKLLTDALTALGEADADAAMALHASLEAAAPGTTVDFAHAESGRTFALTKEMVKFRMDARKVDVEKFVPSVIEPSFGIGRIITGILEHSFYSRPGSEIRNVFAFPPCVAPYKCGVYPLDGRIDVALCASIKADLVRRGISGNLDDTSASIGRRYARADEIGVPFGLTVDFDSLADQTVTVRERDSGAQIRLHRTDAINLIADLCSGYRTWADAMATYTVVTTGDGKVTTASTAAAPAGGAGAGAATGGGARPAPTTTTAAAPSSASASASAATATATATAAADSSKPSAWTASTPGGTAAPKTTMAVEGLDRPYGRFARPKFD